MPLLAPVAGAVAVLVAMAAPELLIALAKLALLGLGAYAFGRMLLRVADALAGWPEDR